MAIREKKLRGNVLIDRLSNNAVRVSFAYPDAVTAQQVTRDLEIMIANNTVKLSDAGFTLSTVVYEEPNVPRTAERPNRLALAAIGLLGGAMLGVLAAFIRRARASG
jgi:LPS O-antigen subunit length determinant protein (WzzB/FepE family)